MKEQFRNYLVWLFSGQCLAAPDSTIGLLQAVVGLGAAAIAVAIFLRWFLVPSCDEWRDITAGHEPVSSWSPLALTMMVLACTIGPPLEEFLFRSWAVWLWVKHGWLIGSAAFPVSVFLCWAGHRYEPVAWAVKGTSVMRPMAMAQMQGIAFAIYLASDVMTGSVMPGLVAHLTWNILGNLWNLGVIDGEKLYAYARSLAP